MLVHISAKALVLCAACAGATALTGSAASADVTRLSGSVGGFLTPVFKGAAVDVRDDTGATAHTVTDARGRYALVGAFDGAVTIVVSYDGYVSEERSCSIPAGDAARADFLLDAQPNPLPPGYMAYWTSGRICTVEAETTDRYVIR